MATLRRLVREVFEELVGLNGRLKKLEHAEKELRPRGSPFGRPTGKASAPGIIKAREKVFKSCGSQGRMRVKGGGEGRSAGSLCRPQASYAPLSHLKLLHSSRKYIRFQI